MPDAPEIPEAKDPFDKRVALTIAILAICLSFIGNLGDNSKTSAILKTSEASDQWNFFQAKSTKALLAAMHGDMIMRLSTDERAADARNRAAQLGKDAQRYDVEKAEIKKEADSLTAQARHFSAINDRCDQAALLLQIAVVICSVAILGQSHKFWWAGMLLGTAGIVVGVTAFLL
jgi:hypothetical protein